MKKKVLSVLLATAMLSTILAGCGGSSSQGSSQTEPDNASSSEAQDSEASNDASSEINNDASNDEAPADDAAVEEVTLKWAIWYESVTPYWNDLKAAYEASLPGVTLEMIDLRSTDHMTVLATELSGSDFDVVTIKDVPSYATLVQKNSILTLDDYISANDVDLAKYAGATDQVTVDGKLYELPFRNSLFCLLVILYLLGDIPAVGIVDKILYRKDKGFRVIVRRLAVLIISQRN